MKKAFVLAIIMVAAAVIGWQILQRPLLSPDKPAVLQNPPVAVEVTPVARATIREKGTYTGTLLPDSRFDIAPKIAGKLEKLFVDIGDNVSHGQMIAVIDDDEYVQQVDQALAELDVARANIEENTSELELKRREFERAQTLREKKIIPEAELDAAQAQYKAALAKQKVAFAQAAQKEAELKTAQVRLGYTRISALWEHADGSRIVGERYVDEGAMLSANAPIVSIMDIDTLKALIHVIELDYPRVKPGQGAAITTDAYPGRIFPGTIERVAPILKEAARQARVEITVANPGRELKPGMFVRVEIEYDRHKDATVIPLNALITHNNRKIVFVADMENMRVSRVPVIVGIIEGDMAEIIEPAIDGYVVTMGQHLLDDGSKITVPERSAGPAPEGSVETESLKNAVKP